MKDKVKELISKWRDSMMGAKGAVSHEAQLRCADELEAALADTAGQAGAAPLLQSHKVKELFERAKSEPFLSGKFQYDFWDNFTAGLNTLLAPGTAPPESRELREAKIKNYLIEVFGVLLAEAEIECGHKHTKTFQQVEKMKVNLEAAGAAFWRV